MQHYANKAARGVQVLIVGPYFILAHSGKILARAFV